jgi:hypothetical protein
MTNDPPVVLISPHFGPAKLASPTLANLIDVFEDRMKYWLLEPAKRLIADPLHRIAGFGLSLSYYEAIWIYSQGEDSEGRSQKFFKAGFLDVWRPSRTDESVLSHVADVFYKDGRCGFFHDGMLRRRLFFSEREGEPLAITAPMAHGRFDPSRRIESIVVHAPKYFEYIEGHFTSFVVHLRDPNQTAARERFQRACHLKWGLSEQPPLIL